MWVNVVGQTRRKDVVTPAYKLTIASEMKLSSMIFKWMKIKMNGMLLGHDLILNIPLICINIE